MFSMWIRIVITYVKSTENKSGTPSMLEIRIPMENSIDTWSCSSEVPYEVHLIDVPIDFNFKTWFQNWPKFIFSCTYRWGNLIRHQSGHPSSHLIRSWQVRFVLSNVAKFCVVVFQCFKVKCMFQFYATVRVTALYNLDRFIFLTAMRSYRSWIFVLTDNSVMNVWNTVHILIKL